MSTEITPQGESEHSSPQTAPLESGESWEPGVGAPEAVAAGEGDLGDGGVAAGDVATTCGSQPACKHAKAVHLRLLLDDGGETVTVSLSVEAGGGDAASRPACSQPPELQAGGLDGEAASRLRALEQEHLGLQEENRSLQHLVKQVRPLAMCPIEPMRVLLGASASTRHKRWPMAFSRHCFIPLALACPQYLDGPSLKSLQEAATQLLEGGEQRYAIGLSQLEKLLAQKAEADASVAALLAPAQAQLAEAQRRAEALKVAFLTLVSDVVAASKRAVAAASKAPQASVSDRVLDYFLSTEPGKASEVQALRLQAATLAAQVVRAERQLKESDQLSEGLHLLDYEQLRIENTALAAKIEGGGAEVQKLQGRAVEAIQVFVAARFPGCIIS